MENTDDTSFGGLLRNYREGTVDRRTRTKLSQTEFAEKLSKLTSLKITRNKVGYWETNTTAIPVQDRKMLLAIVDVLHEYGGITRIEEANLLLTSGGYRPLDPAEAAKINQDWGMVAENQRLATSARGSGAASTSVPLDSDKLQPSILTTIAAQFSNMIPDTKNASPAPYSTGLTYILRSLASITRS